MGFSRRMSCLGFICVWFVAIFRTSDGGSITWHEPPPVKTETDNTVPSTADSIQLFKGRSASLSWNFTLTGETFASVSLESKTETVASIQPAFGVVAVTPGFENRFNVSWIDSQKATLIIFNVITDDSGDFSCKTSSVLQAAIKVWTRKIQVAVVDPARITATSGNQTVDEGDNVTLGCTVVGEPTPIKTWTKLSDNSTVNSTIHITGKQDEGVYRCTASNGVGSPASADVFITVQNYRPENTNFATSLNDNITVVNTDFNLICSAQANPPAKYRFYKEQESLFNTTTGSNVAEHTTSVTERINQVQFSCTPFNDLYGDGPTDTITVTVHYPPIVTAPSPEPVKEGNGTTLFCNATGNPTPNITWTKKGNNSVLSTTNTLNLTNLMRGDNGAVYTCKAENVAGPGEATTTITVLYKPYNVTLVANTTGNKNCSESVWANFTCKAFDANPVVKTYWLYGNENGPIADNSGTWIQEISEKGKHVYSCLAQHLLENVTSAKNVTLTVNVRATVNLINDNEPVKEGGFLTVTEGRNVYLKCDASGFPDPTITWKKDGVAEPSGVKWFNITNISRNQSGQYRCLANNTCGNPSSVTSIDVQYEPENVRLNVNISNNKVCAGIIVFFTCAADANPLGNYTLYENHTMLNMSRSGERIKAIHKHGQVIYTCEANNSVGSGKSSSIALNVEIPVYVQQINREINVTEGGNVTEVCNASAGIFPAAVTWIKDGVVVPTVGKWLNIINISRNETGQYKCLANNTCGNNSTLTRINVQYEPENVRLNVNISNNKVCAGIIVLFTCTADANPEVNNFTLYENDTMLNMSRSGERIKAISKHGRVTYTCEGNNSVGSKKSSSITLNVEVPVYVQQINREINVAEGRNVTEVCNASAGIFPPTVTWTKDDDVVPTVGKWLNIINISRNKTGQYKCLANNTCGNNSTSTRINVQYPPSVTDDSMIFNVSKGKMATLSCPVDGNPAPSITWHEGNDTSSQILHRGEKWTIQTTSLNIKWHWYSCSARNNFGTVNATVRLLIVPPTVTSPTATSPITSKETSPDIKLTLTVTDRDCNESPQVKQGICVELSRIIVNGAGVTHCKVENTRCGSVIVDFVLRFNQSVSADEVVSALKTAAEQNEFRSYTVDPESIKQTSSSPTKEPPCKESLFKDAKCELKVHIVVIIAVGGALVIACVIGGATYYWVHKKRKCRKDPRIHNSDDQEALQSNQSGVDENAHSQVNGGYADSGPPSANGTRADEQTGANGTDAPVKQQQQEQVQGAPPTHAVVDKSTKKKKKEEEKKKKEEEKRRKEEEKKKKNEAEQNIPQYAVVDKSQRKKKEVVEDAYAQVDMSRKSKKKPKPGEVLYADLGDFQPKQMPAVSTSPETLPPVKRPPAYQETQYADITQFLKGDATLPDANNSQGTEMTYANVEGGKGTPKENANEEKPKETANGGGNEEKPKETPL